MLPANKLAGAIFELQFRADALRHGLVPHPAPYDLCGHDVLLTNAAGRAMRIQVKGTTKKAGRISMPAHEMDFDYLAGYVDPLRAWWIIPRDALPHRCRSITLTTNGLRKRWREKWSELQS